MFSKENFLHCSHLNFVIMPSAFVEACAFKYVSYITNILLSESLLLEHGWFSVIWEVWEVVVVWQVQKKKKKLKLICLFSINLVYPCIMKYFKTSGFPDCAAWVTPNY